MSSCNGPLAGGLNIGLRASLVYPQIYPGATLGCASPMQLERACCPAMAGRMRARLRAPGNEGKVVRETRLARRISDGPASNVAQLARTVLSVSLSRARRCPIEPFRKLAKTITERLEAVVRGMIENRSNDLGEAMNRSLQAKRAATGFRTATNLIAVAYLRLSRLKHLPANPLQLASPKLAPLVHRCL